MLHALCVLLAPAPAPPPDAPQIFYAYHDDLTNRRASYLVWDGSLRYRSRRGESYWTVDVLVVRRPEDWKTEPRRFRPFLRGVRLLGVRGAPHRGRPLMLRDRCSWWPDEVVLVLTPGEAHELDLFLQAGWLVVYRVRRGADGEPIWGP
jgi:hypothetical protein